MTQHVVAMPIIPGQIRRGRFTRSSLAYSKYSIATWQWWCAKNGVDFITFDAPLGGDDFSDKPPTIQRWLIPDVLMRERGKDTRVALVDADTMIRWDTPSFMNMSTSFGAVKGRDSHWISNSISAFQGLFPGTSLKTRDYFNAGVVVLGQPQLKPIGDFLEFVFHNWTKLSAVISSGNFGTDQTPLNFVLRRDRIPVQFLPAQYNMVHCFPMDPILFAMDNSPAADPIEFAIRAFQRREAFQFCDRGYIWHFSNLVAFRATVMRQVWRRVAANYPGADCAFA